MDSTREHVRKLPTSELVRGIRELANDFNGANRGELDQLIAMVLEEAAERLEKNG